MKIYFSQYCFVDPSKISAITIIKEGNELLYWPVL